ncbi:MAG: hypothetical protein GY937_00305 [bacterium]|nr:hypothetical protein [bacterium]
MIGGAVRERIGLRFTPPAEVLFSALQGQVSSDGFPLVWLFLRRVGGAVRSRC